jgi:hypothetical protein
MFLKRVYDTGVSMKHLVAALGVLLLCLLPCPTLGWDFRVVDVEGLANVSLAYGLLARTQGRDKDLIAIANDGKAPSANKARPPRRLVPVHRPVLHTLYGGSARQGRSQHRNKSFGVPLCEPTDKLQHWPRASA